MEVFPRSSWTSVIPGGQLGSDRIDDLLYFLPRNVKGIMIHSDQVGYDLINRDPMAHLDNVRRGHVAQQGFSDIKYNLGVAPRVRGVWELRGLMTKGAATDVIEYNNDYIHVYAMLGRDEKPTDILLQNLVEARQLVLGRYPNATAVLAHDKHESKPTACPGEYLTKVVDSEIWGTPPVGKSKSAIRIPQTNLREGSEGAPVFDLISQLQYFGYIRSKNTGKYDSNVSQAVRELQNDLKVSGVYRRTVDGLYGPYTRRAWNSELTTLRNMANG